MRYLKKISAASLAMVLSLVFLGGCGQANQQPEGNAEKMSGEIAIDGSSTVYPITAAVGEEFQQLNPDVKVTVGFSGTGGGFEKFLQKETDINDASRAIKAEEIAKAEENKIDYKEIKIAYDGLSVVVSHDNDFVDSLTVDELKRIWEPNSKVKTWKDVRAEWPAEEIKLFGPGSDSGTFEYFTEEVVGEKGAIRTDYTASEDDNVLVNGVAGEKNGMGFFGYAYYVENKDKLKVVPIDNGSGPVEPNEETVKSGAYAPLSRPLFMYVRTESLKKAEVKAFLEFYLKEGTKVIPSVGYVPLNEDEYKAGLDMLAE